MTDAMTGELRIDFPTYLADPAPEPSLSRGGIVQLINGSPAKAWWNHPRLNPDYPKEERDESKFDPGKAAHNLLLEGGNNITVIAGFDNWKKDDAKDKRAAAWKEGIIPLLTKQFDVVSAMAEAARVQILNCEELGVSDLPTEGTAELTFIWQEKNGVWCRIRPDWIRNDRTLLLDYKTSGTSANPDDFAGHMGKMDYPIQSAFYRRGVSAVTGVEDPEFVIIAQEDEPPYLCSFMGIDLQHEDMAQEKVRFAIRLFGHCLKSGKWPGYPKRVCYAEPKPWDVLQWASRKYALEELLNGMDA